MKLDTFLYVGSLLLLASATFTVTALTMVRPPSTVGRRLTFTGAVAPTPDHGPIRRNKFRKALFANSKGDEEACYTSINKSDMKDILDDLETQDENGSRYVVLDVRNPDEVAETGPLSAKSRNLPLSRIKNEKVLQLSDKEFEEACGFSKPSSTNTLVFSCKAGKRAEMAAEQAARDGYEDIFVYSGSANDWFS